MAYTKSQIEENFRTIRCAVEKQTNLYNRSSTNVNLVAVSKKQPVERIHTALEYGHRIFGENRVQDALERWGSIKPAYPDLKLHLIGPLQTNKVKDAVSLFDVIETVDRPKLADAIATEIKKQNKSVDCYIQVNTGEEEQKSGVAVFGLSDLLEHCREIDLGVSGLMCIPPQNEPAALHFALLNKLAKQHGLQNISMGMSGDFEEAISLGATHIRIGTAIFGKRDG